MGIKKVAISVLIPGVTVVNISEMDVDNGFSFRVNVNGYKHRSKIEWFEEIFDKNILNIDVSDDGLSAVIIGTAIGTSELLIKGKTFRHRIAIHVREKVAVAHRIVRVN